jgi:hypothetical protein
MLPPFSIIQTITHNLQQALGRCRGWLLHSTILLAGGGCDEDIVVLVQLTHLQGAYQSSQVALGLDVQAEHRCAPHWCQQHSHLAQQQAQIQMRETHAGTEPEPRRRGCDTPGLAGGPSSMWCSITSEQNRRDFLGGLDG